MGLSLQEHFDVLARRIENGRKAFGRHFELFEGDERPCQREILKLVMLRASKLCASGEIEFNSWQLCRPVNNPTPSAKD